MCPVFYKVIRFMYTVTDADGLDREWKWNWKWHSVTNFTRSWPAFPYPCISAYTRFFNKKVKMILIKSQNKSSLWVYTSCFLWDTRLTIQTTMLKRLKGKKWSCDDFWKHFRWAHPDETDEANCSHDLSCDLSVDFDGRIWTMSNCSSKNNF